MLKIQTPPGADVGIGPGQQVNLLVEYLDKSTQRGISGAKISFAIFGDPKGSTLSSDSVISSEHGLAKIEVRGGAVSSRFQVRVSASRAPDAVFYLEVSNAGFGSLSISSQYSGALSTTDLTRLTYSLYDNINCSSFDPIDPLSALRSRTASKPNQVVPFKALPLNINHTLSAVAYRKITAGGTSLWQPRAAGCVEVPIGVLIPNTSQTMIMHLSDIQPRTTGTFSLTSTIKLPKTNRPLADALHPWARLTLCPLDPAQLMVDCVIDAMDPGDPLDCAIVAPGPKAKAILAARGTLSGACRGATSGKAASLEKIITASMAGNAEQMISALSKVELRAVGVLSNMELKSTLDILQQSTTGKVVASHRLESVAFTHLGTSATYKTSDVGLPRWLTSPVYGDIKQGTWNLTIDKHPFSLRYGALASRALGDLVFTKLGLPASSQAVAAALVTATTYPKKVTKLTGCPAIDAIFCEAGRLSPGCLGQACVQGKQALSAFLDSGFVGMDAKKDDLTLAGNAVLLDNDGDAKIDQIGDSTVLGTWAAILTLGDEAVTSSEATFLGKQ